MGKTNGNASVHGIADVSPEKLAARVAGITKHLEAIDALLSDAKALANATRKSALRLRGPDEVAALNGVLAFAELHTELFVALANEDEGVDPKRFEPELLLSRLANAQTLGALADRVEVLHKKLADCALYTVNLVKPPTLAAYEIAKPFQGHDLPGDELLTPAVNFYRGIGAKAVRSRAAKKAAATATSSPLDAAK